jgi:hypothetical protein
VVERCAGLWLAGLFGGSGLIYGASPPRPGEWQQPGQYEIDRPQGNCYNPSSYEIAEAIFWLSLSSDPKRKAEDDEQGQPVNKHFRDFDQPIHVFSRNSEQAASVGGLCHFKLLQYGCKGVAAQISQLVAIGQLSRRMWWWLGWWWRVVVGVVCSMALLGGGRGVCC